MRLIALTKEEILTEITPIMDNMMQGSNEVDHAKHSRDFTQRMQGLVTPYGLTLMCQEYQAHWGYFAHREFVALFRRHDSIAIVWKQYCTKSTDEYVAEAVFVEQNNRLLIDHAMVF
jgi:hypothetical protein